MRPKLKLLNTIRQNLSGRSSRFGKLAPRIMAGSFTAIIVFSALMIFTTSFCRSDTGRTNTNWNHGAQTRIVILKSDQILEIYENERKVKRYRVCLGLNPLGPKVQVGDRKTPEGEYFICMKNRESQFHLFMGISYPGEHDAQTAFEKGRISLETRDSIIQKVRRGKTPPWNTKLGGWVGIHGYPTQENARRWISLLFPKPHNWTDGCIALWNFEIEEIFSRVPLGAPVTILP